MRRKLRFCLGALLFMLATTLMFDAGAIGSPHAVAHAGGYCAFVDPVPPWQGGYVCTP